MLVTDILEICRERGSFVRQDRHHHGCWYDIGDESAREKIGQTIREMMVRKDPAKKARARMRRAMNKNSSNKSPSPNPMLLQSKLVDSISDTAFSAMDEALAAMPPELSSASSKTWFVKDLEKSLTNDMQNIDDLLQILPLAA